MSNIINFYNQHQSNLNKNILLKNNNSLQTNKMKELQLKFQQIKNFKIMEKINELKQNKNNKRFSYKPLEMSDL